jgi:hypothetical protein
MPTSQITPPSREPLLGETRLILRTFPWHPVPLTVEQIFDGKEWFDSLSADYWRVFEKVYKSSMDSLAKANGIITVDTVTVAPDDQSAKEMKE